MTLTVYRTIWFVSFGLSLVIAGLLIYVTEKGLL